MKNKAKLILLFAILATTLFISCECPECFTPPQELAIRLVDKNDSSDILFKNRANQKKISFYYLENNIQESIEFDIFNDTIEKKSVILSGYPGFLSSLGNKYFYLKLDDIDIDTILYDVEEVSLDCCTYYETKTMKYNDNIIFTDKKEFVYIVNK